MADNVYQVGDKVRVFGTWTSTAGAVVDPTALRLRYRVPGSTVTVFTYSTSQSNIVRISTGAYRADIVTTVRGLHRYRWDSSGTGTAAEEGQFRVEGGLI